MRVVIGLRPTNEVQEYALDILRRVPEKHKGDLVARAVYSYLGGKEMSDDDLAIMLTGGKRKRKKRASGSMRTATRPPAPASASPSRPPAAQEPSREESYAMEQIVPTGLSEESAGYEFGKEDAEMISDVMAAFAAQSER